jgi:hypothetical protein
MDKIQFIKQDSFPLTSDVMEKLQSIAKTTTALANIIGSLQNNYIVEGCSSYNGNTASGIVLIEGELLPFLGGATQSHVEVVETPETLSAFGNSYPGAILKRVVQFTSSVGGTHQWNLFKSVAEMSLVNQFYNQMAIVTTPVGTILPYLGATAPNKYVMADGQPVDANTYIDLWQMMTNNPGATPSAGSTFSPPDLRNRFLVGANSMSDFMNGGIVDKATTVTDSILFTRINYIIRAIR